MEELIAYIARNLVDKPDEVRVVRSAREDAVVFEVHVAPDDIGKMIGRHGRIARALRTVVRAGGAKTGERTLVEIVE